MRVASDTFEALRAQEQINRIVGEAPGEELDEGFGARYQARLEDLRQMLLKERIGNKRK